MKLIFENWRKHLAEAAAPHSAQHVVNKMREIMDNEHLESEIFKFEFEKKK